MKNAINWFEIPVTELERAAKFYEVILQVKLKRERFNGTEMAIVPVEEGAVGGALVLSEKQTGEGGTLVYLNANGNLDGMLGRVGQAGGAVLLKKTSIGDPGFIAVIQDTEGNRIGLHSENV